MSYDAMVNVGLVGCGRIAPRHVQSIAQIENARLVAVADRIEERARRFADETGADAYTDIRYLLDRDDIDCIDICTPSGLHAQMGIQAAEVGKHILVEKPMALTVADADNLIRAARQAKVKLGVVLQNRYNPPMEDLYQAVNNGKFGKILLGSATVRWYRPQEYYQDDWHGTWAMDGGALMNQSIHHIDALNWLMGSPVESVVAYTATLAHEIETEDTGVAILRFANGALATVEGSTITYPQNIEGSVAIFGEHGSAKVGGTALNRKIFWKLKGQLEAEREMITQENLDPPSVYGFSHLKVLEDMVLSIIEDRDPLTNGSEARKSVVLVNAMYASARTGEPVSIDWGVKTV
jgi:predicted dehydrogenase